jgi:hypothetical protein
MMKAFYRGARPRQMMEYLMVVVTGLLVVGEGPQVLLVVVAVLASSLGKRRGGCRVAVLAADAVETLRNPCDGNSDVRNGWREKKRNNEAKHNESNKGISLPVQLCPVPYRGRPQRARRLCHRYRRRSTLLRRIWKNCGLCLYLRILRRLYRIRY